MTTAPTPAPHTPGGRTNTGPRATRVLDGGVHSVKLEVSPLARSILNDLFDAMQGQGYALAVGARTYRTNLARQRLIDRMLDQPAVRAAFDQDIAVEAALTLEDDLYEACMQADWCRSCGDAYATVLDHCDDCHNRASNRGPVRWA